MNRLSRAAQAEIIRLLVEGNSLRAITRITGRSINTVTKLLVDLGAAADAYQDGVFRNLTCRTLQADEIWSFVYARPRNVLTAKRPVPGAGEAWTFTAIDADTKLIPAWMIGNRTPEDARTFLTDLADRLGNRVQLTTDGHRIYLAAVPDTFGDGIDFAQLVKIYAVPKDEFGRASGTTEVIGTQERIVSGNPDIDKINTSFVERQNLTMRMGMRRFTRMSNGFSKKIENHAAAVALHFLYYNFARPHKSLANPYPRTPAMAAGLADHVWTLEEMAALVP